MPLSRHALCSHAVTNTLWSKEETDNTLIDKTEQVTSGMKQGCSFQILRLFKKFKQSIPFCDSLMCRDRSLYILPQFKRHVNW